MSIENEIQEEAAKAPRVTPADIEAAIIGENYFTAAHGRIGAIEMGEFYGKEAPLPEAADLIPLTLLTFCVLILKNGFTVTGESVCVSPENFNAEIGRKVARNNAIAKMWPLLGYALRDKLAS